MRIQDALSNCCEGIKDFASVTANKVGKITTAIGNCIGETARKAADFAKPQFENFKTFAQENRQPIIISAVAFAVGVATAIIMSKVFCRGTNTVSSTGTTLTGATAGTGG